jgi:hypothetical protein
MEGLQEVCRTEKKYPVGRKTAGQIEARLSYLLPLDEHCKNGKPYLVRSLYFDSMYDQDYFQKESGLELRKKIRLRTYGADGAIKLEWKRKQGKMQKKTSLTVSKEEAECLIRGDYGFLKERREETALRLYGLMTEAVYRPKCMIEYQRLAFTVPVNDIRITLDSQITSQEGSFSLFNEHQGGYPVIGYGRAVLEVKYNHFLLDYIRTALYSYNLVEAAEGKYSASRYFGLGGSKL